MISFVDGMVTDQRDLTDDLYAQAEKHNESGAWQMIFGVNTLPEYRRRGIAYALLQRVCEDAKADGFDVVQACPLKEFVSTQYDYAGPATMFAKAGFTVCRDLGDHQVMRKTL